MSYPVPQGYRGLDCKALDDVQVDTNRATATGIYASSTQDREGDTVNIAGIMTDNHRKNPVVLWLHGFDFKQEEGSWPIGVTEDPKSGLYSCELDSARGIAYATTFFSQKTLLAAQICALVMEKTIRGQSIGYKELEVSPVRDRDGRVIGRSLDRIEQIEVSWVPVPMNQDAVRAVLDSTVCGKGLHPSIKQALTPYASPAPVWANGFTFGGTMTGTKGGTEQELQDQAAAQARRREQERLRQLSPDEQLAELRGVDVPHGLRLIMGLHKCYSQAKACVKAFADVNENETVRRLADSQMESVQGLHDDLKAAHKDLYEEAHGKLPDESNYGYREDKTKDDDDDGGDESEEQKTLRRQLREAKLQLQHEKRLLDQHERRLAGVTPW
jgi:hypothetical protein